MISEDRLSLLPDELIHHILSFLPDSYEAARTTVLSSRFRHIWAHHPSICLAQSAYIASYRRHVDLCLSSHNLPLLCSLDLSLVTSRSAHRWIHKVSTRSPSLSSLRIFTVKKISFPRPVFACRSLVSLEIDSIDFPYLPSSFSGFLSLTNLNLKDSDIYSNQTLTSFLTKCPNLTTLSLTSIKGLTSLHISSTKLTHLNITQCDPLNSLHISSTKLTHLNITQCYLKTLCVEAPNLTSISYTGYVDSLYLDNACQLVDAVISQSSRGFSNHSKWVRAVMDLRHVSNKLQVDEWFFEYLLPDNLPNPLFNNLKVLHCCVEWINPPLLDGLASILDHCSNLEQLIIDMSAGRQDWNPYFSRTDWLDRVEQYLEEEKERQVWDPPQKEIKYDNRRDLARNLKNVTVDCFIGTPNEMKMLEYLLGKASILEKLIIADCMFRSLEEIRLLFACIPRASSHLQICQPKTTL